MYRDNIVCKFNINIVPAKVLFELIAPICSKTEPLMLATPNLFSPMVQWSKSYYCNNISK